MQIHYQDPPLATHLDWLRTRLPKTVRLTTCENTDAISACDYLICGVPEPELLQEAVRLRGLIIPWAGVPRRTRTLLIQYPTLELYNLHHNARPAAELAVSLMLAAAKRLIATDNVLRKGDWRPRYESERSVAALAGRTAVILGFGAIGRRIERACRGLGLNTVAVTRTSREPDGKTEFMTIDLLDSVLPRARFLFICLPLTSETEGLMGRKRLRMLPDGSVLVNIARGKIIDEQALFEELASGRIAAGLDVWYNYPEDEASRQQTLPSAFPFHELDNVVMTPHMGGNAEDVEKLRMEALLELLSALNDGSEVPNRVDLARGY